VLQSTTVFTNVSKAVLAKDKDLMNVFGTTDQEKICLIILEKGEFQVSDKERKLEYENLFKDVASILVDKCINPETQKPYTMSMLERVFPHSLPAWSLSQLPILCLSSSPCLCPSSPIHPSTDNISVHRPSRMSTLTSTPNAAPSNKLWRPFLCCSRSSR